MEDFQGLIVSSLMIDATLKGGKQDGIVKNISFSIPKGRKLAIVGASGCGKTMTAMAILGLLPDNCVASGSVCWDSQELLILSEKERRKLLGTKHVLIPQSGADFLNPVLTIGKQMRQTFDKNHIPRNAQVEKMSLQLRQVGITQPERVLKSYPFQLSGGMAQRVVMAIASTGSPQLVIADEPTRGIDQANRSLFMHNLNALFGKAAVLLITHDISVASACDDILVMQAGRIEEYGKAESVLTKPASPYTKVLLDALPGGRDALYA